MYLKDSCSRVKLKCKPTPTLDDGCNLNTVFHSLFQSPPAPKVTIIITICKFVDMACQLNCSPSSSAIVSGSSV